MSHLFYGTLKTTIELIAVIKMFVWIQVISQPVSSGLSIVWANEAYLWTWEHSSYPLLFIYGHGSTRHVHSSSSMDMGALIMSTLLYLWTWEHISCPLFRTCRDWESSLQPLKEILVRGVGRLSFLWRSKLKDVSVSECIVAIIENCAPVHPRSCWNLLSYSFGRAEVLLCRMQFPL